MTERRGNPGTLQDLGDKGKPFCQLRAEWEQLAGPVKRLWLGCSSTVDQGDPAGRATAEPSHRGAGQREPRAHCSPQPSPQGATLSWRVLPLCPPGCPTLPTGAKERGDHPTWLSPVIQQCRGGARLRPAGSYPELLFANWRKCSGV